MKAFLLLPLFFCLVVSAHLLAGPRPIERLEWTDIRRGIIETYSGAETYRDRGVVRGVYLQAREAFVEGSDLSYEVVQDRILYFETAYRSGTSFRMETLVPAGRNREMRMVFTRTKDAAEIQNDGERRSVAPEGLIPSAGGHLSFHDVRGSEIPALLYGMRSQEVIWNSGSHIEEVGYNNRPAYRLTGRDRLDTFTLWVDQETMLILAMERVRQTGARSMVVVTTLYQPERNVSLDQTVFGPEPTDFSGHAGLWHFPPIDVAGALARMEWARTGTLNPSSSLPPPFQDAPGSSGASYVSSRPPAPSVDVLPVVSPAPTPARITADQLAAVVLIEGESGQGTGFLTRINDISFVITNLHVLADAKTLRIRNSRGQQLAVRGIHAARGHDVALIRVDETPGGLVMAADAAASLIGDEVVVLGNRLGGGVVTQERGGILGIGPDRIEVDAKFQRGNSGSPILNIGTGEVIGIASYLQEVSILGIQPTTGSEGKPSRETTTRWFGYRFDSISQWERLDWNEWQRQGAELRAFRERSEVLLALLQGEREVYMRDPAFRRIVERFERDVTTHRISNDEYARRVREFINELLNYGRADLRRLDGQFYDYFSSSLYFDTSIPLQRDFRRQLIQYLEDRERDVRAFRQMLGR